MLRMICAQQTQWHRSLVSPFISSPLSGVSCLCIPVCPPLLFCLDVLNVRTDLRPLRKRQVASVEIPFVILISVRLADWVWRLPHKNSRLRVYTNAHHALVSFPRKLDPSFAVVLEVVFLTSWVTVQHHCWASKTMHINSSTMPLFYFYFLVLLHISSAEKQLF